MGLFGKKDGGFQDVIRCDEPSYLVWKWHPDGVELGQGKRENAIRNGSSLRVKDGEVAVFVYKQKDGTMQDFIVGPYDEKIKTKNFPILASIVGLAFDGGTPFQAEIYFINLAKVIQIKFGVPFFDVYDPRFIDFGVPTAVRGTISFQIDDYKEFIKLHRLINFSFNDFQIQIKDAVTKYVKTIVSNLPSEANLSVVQIERKISQISNVLEKKLKERLQKDFGVNLTGLDISDIEIDKTSEGYQSLIAITKDITTATIQTQTMANLENYAENLRIKREEQQYATHKQTQMANLDAYKIEQQTAVGIAGANALGQMGVNGAGGVDMSGGGIGFNPAAMMAGIALGGAVGQNIAGIMNGMMSVINNPQTPPPMSNVLYYVAQNGKSTGPYDMSILTQMASKGTLVKETLVWKQGMQNWCKAVHMQDLQQLFTFPPLPPQS